MSADALLWCLWKIQTIQIPSATLCPWMNSRIYSNKATVAVSCKRHLPPNSKRLSGQLVELADEQLAGGKEDSVSIIQAQNLQESHIPDESRKPRKPMS